MWMKAKRGISLYSCVCCGGELILGTCHSFSWLQKAFTALFAEWVKAQSHINDADIPYRFSAKFLGDCAKSNPNFEQVTTWEMDVQIGNWKPAPTQELYYANELCKMNVLKLIEAYVPLMASSGVSEEWTKRWQFEAMKEIQEQKLHTYGRWRWMWCRRGDSEWIPNN
ncbi:hypothetical protein FRC03_008105 [Tulasnella sp. 419]|nr:hypothetical protein FRC03_008105 [Tulasnella sp. 419]